MLTLEEVRQATGIQAYTTNSKGQIRLEEGLSLATKKRYLKVAHTVYKDKDKGWRLVLGNTVNDLRLPYGEKVKHCKKAFGEQAGQTIYSYSVTAANWNDERQDHNIPWTLYKDAGLLPSDLKLCLVSKFTSGEWKLPQCLEFCSKWKQQNRPRNSRGISSDLKTDQNKRNSLLADSLSATNREFLQALQQLSDEEARRALQVIIDSHPALAYQEETDEFAEDH